MYLTQVNHFKHSLLPWHREHFSQNQLGSEQWSAVIAHPILTQYSIFNLCSSVFHYRFAFPKLLEQCSQGNYILFIALFYHLAIFSTTTY